MSGMMLVFREALGVVGVGVVVEYIVWVVLLKVTGVMVGEGVVVVMVVRESRLSSLGVAAVSASPVAPPSTSWLSSDRTSDTRTDDLENRKGKSVTADHLV